MSRFGGPRTGGTPIARVTWCERRVNVRGGQTLTALTDRRARVMAMMTSPDRLRVLVVDDHDTFAELLVGALDREVDLVCVGHATTGGEGDAMVDRLGPDVVLMDIQLPDMD